MEFKLISIKNYLSELFPESWQQLKDLRATDEDFRIICDDYEACMQLINTNTPANALSSELVKEYKELCSNLESEIAHYLKASSTKNSNTHQKLSKNEELKNV